MKGRPASAYTNQGLVFVVAFGGSIRTVDSRNYKKVSCTLYISICRYVCMYVCGSCA